MTKDDPLTEADRRFLRHQFRLILIMCLAIAVYVIGMGVVVYELCQSL